jgi:beta-galactosidase GanA
MHWKQFIAISLSVGIASVALSQSKPDKSLPHLVQKDGRYALYVDGAPYLMLGAQVNNSSAWPAVLPQVWPTVERIGVNTLEVPIYWEQFEPTKGHFDPSILNTLLAQAREHYVHLVLLWFGTWKNASDHYAPEFFKLNEAEIPHVVNKDGRKLDSIAPYSEVGLNADRTAFAELMKTLRLADPQHTVLMVQVENEIGLWGGVRDFSPTAEKLFNAPVPVEVLKAMQKTETGTWAKVFGKDADEFFYAWSIARYVQQVAAAGKAQYPLPLYINVETRNPINGGPGSYESGGAVDTVIPIWKAIAPAIDLFGPDQYTADYDVFTKLLDIYHRPDNAMFVPEASNDPQFARYFFATLGHEGIGFSPFGLDTTGYSNRPLGVDKIDTESTAALTQIYKTFGPMDRSIAKLNFEGNVQAVSEDPAKPSQTLDFGGWRAKVSYGLGQFGSDSIRVKGAPVVPSGGAMVAQLGDNEFLVTGVHARVEFIPADPKLQRQWLRVEEGSYIDGVWHMTRLWNGDQSDYGLNFTDLQQVLRVTVATY